MEINRETSLFNREQEQRINELVTQLSSEMTTEKNIDQNIDSLVSRANDIQAKRFIQEEQEDKGKYYHDKDGQHPKDIERRALQVADIVGAEPSDKRLIRIAASLHDFVRSEVESAEITKRVIDQLNEKSDQNSQINKADKQKVTRAIVATIPQMSPVKDELGSDYITATQPLLEAKSIVELAVALADVNTATFDGAEAFLKDGKNLGEEIFHFDSISDDQTIKKLAKNWFGSQANFCIGRSIQINSEISSTEGITTNQKVKLATELNSSKSQEAISAATMKSELVNGIADIGTIEELRALIIDTDPLSISEKYSKLQTKKQTQQ